MKDKAVYFILLGNGIFVILTLFLIFLFLLMQAVPALEEIDIIEFFTSARWNPTSFQKPGYGILSMVIGTMSVTAIAMLIAIPLGVGSALYLAEVAHPRIREIVKPVLELLTAVPSVVIGFIGIVVLSPLLVDIFGEMGMRTGLNIMNGGILLSLMSLPTIISISEDAIRNVPGSFKEASLALGASHWYTLKKVILPAASSGVIASIMLGMGRAIGETMTVLMACGNSIAIPESLFDPARTLTATIAIEMGEVAQGTIHYHSLFLIGLVLFGITFIINWVADNFIRKRK